MQEIQIEAEEVSRIIELETEFNTAKLQLADLELQKIDQIEIVKARIVEKLNYLNKLKKKYNFTHDNFTIDVDKKIIKIL